MRDAVWGVITSFVAPTVSLIAMSARAMTSMAPRTALGILWALSRIAIVVFAIVQLQDFLRSYSYRITGAHRADDPHYAYNAANAVSSGVLLAVALLLSPSARRGMHARLRQLDVTAEASAAASISGLISQSGMSTSRAELETCAGRPCALSARIVNVTSTISTVSLPSSRGGSRASSASVGARGAS